MEFLNFNDTIFYSMGKNNTIFSNTIVVLCEIDGVVDERPFWENKILEMVNKYPKFSKIVMNECGNLYWKKNEFQVNNHLQIIQQDEFNDEKYSEYLDTIINTPFKKNTPKWVWYITTSQNKTFLTMKMDHSYGDGEFLVHQIFKEILCDSNYTLDQKSSNNNVSNNIFKILQSIYFFLASLVSILYFLLFFKKEQIFDIPKENCKAKWKSIHTFDINLLKEKKNTLNITINDLLYGIILDSLKKYANKDNINISSASMFNLRNPQNQSDNANNFGFVMFSTPAGHTDLYKYISKQMNYYKKSPIIPCITNLFKCIFHIYSPLVIKFIDFVFNKNNFVYSNYNSKIKSLSINNKKVLSAHNIVIPYKQDIFFSLVSYGDKIILNMCYKDGAINEAKLMSCFTQVINDL